MSDDNKVNDGGPAFPSWDDNVGPTHGMSLRANFAKTIMAGMAAGAFWAENFQRGKREPYTQDIDDAAKVAVAAADALIAALKK